MLFWKINLGLKIVFLLEINSEKTLKELIEVWKHFYQLFLFKMVKMLICSR